VGILVLWTGLSGGQAYPEVVGQHLREKLFLNRTLTGAMDVLEKVV
jgi:hypothetical protein